jgi:hypothetical protein
MRISNKIADFALSSICTVKLVQNYDSSNRDVRLTTLSRWIFNAILVLTFVRLHQSSMEKEKEQVLGDLQQSPAGDVSPGGTACDPNSARRPYQPDSWSEDPANPRNWQSQLKWIHVLYVALMTFLV